MPRQPGIRQVNVKSKTSPLSLLRERDADDRAGGILTLRTASDGREQGIAIAVTMAVDRLVKLSNDGHTDQIN